MPTKLFFRLAAVLVTALVSSARAQLPATMPSEPDFQKLLHDLDSESPETRDQAEAKIMVYPLSLPELTQTAGEPGLSPEAAKRVQHCIDLLGPGYEARMRKRKEEEFVQDNRHQNGVTAYQSFGDHNPKWDYDATVAIQLSTETPSADDQQNAPKIVQLCGNALAAGCKDPIIKYFHARFEYNLPDAVSHSNEIIPELRAAAIEMLQSKYAARLRTNAVFDALAAQENLVAYKSVLSSDDDRKLLDQCLALLPDIVQQEKIPWRIHESVSLLQYHYTAVLGDDKKAFDTIFPALSKAMPNSAEPLYYKGNFYVQYAWDARGNGWANTVTEERWKLFGKRLAVARDALTQAYSIDPNDARAATEMITVCMGQNKPSDEMETWFDRAINADPDSQSACEAKLTFLEPKWDGSQEAALAFGRACLATEDWSGTLPQIIIDAHLELAQETDNPDQYFENPAVWDDVQKVYAGELAIWPDDLSCRSWYAYLACRCGQFSVANTQFKILGDRVDVSPFGTAHDLGTWRQKAAQQIADTQKSN